MLKFKMIFLKTGVKISLKNHAMVQKDEHGMISQGILLPV